MRFIVYRAEGIVLVVWTNSFIATASNIPQDAVEQILTGYSNSSVIWHNLLQWNESFTSRRLLKSHQNPSKVKKATLQPAASRLDRRKETIFKPSDLKAGACELRHPVGFRPEK